MTENEFSGWHRRKPITPISNMIKEKVGDMDLLNKFVDMMN